MTGLAASPVMTQTFDTCSATTRRVQEIQPAGCPWERLTWRMRQVSRCEYPLTLSRPCCPQDKDA